MTIEKIKHRIAENQDSLDQAEKQLKVAYTSEEIAHLTLLIESFTYAIDQLELLLEECE
jgi:hypothetical protein